MFWSVVKSQIFTFQVLNIGGSQENIMKRSEKKVSLTNYSYMPGMPLKGLETDVEIDLGLELCARSCAEAVILWYGAVPYQVSPDRNYVEKNLPKRRGREGPSTFL